MVRSGSEHAGLPAALNAALLKPGALRLARADYRAEAVR